MQLVRSVPILVVCASIAVLGTLLCTSRIRVHAAHDPAPPSSPIIISPVLPSELNGSGGGAPNATFDQASQFAWQEFIALNWPAGPQQGQPMQRDTPSTTCKFSDPTCTGPLTWETMRGKVETFPGQGSLTPIPPPGYPGQAGDKSFGYDALPAYVYSAAVPACDAGQSGDPTPWINLDETDQILLDNMYAGVTDPNSSYGNSAPQLIRFLAKSNREEYVYVVGNSSPTDPSRQWWVNVPDDVVAATKDYLKKHMASPASMPKNSTTVSLPNGTVEMKAGWRPLSADEIKSGHFHTEMVRFYEKGSSQGISCYRDQVWGLVALHIIQKTASAPYFIYATFEQTDNLLTANGTPIEDADGKVVNPAPATATAPQTCLIDPQPKVTPPPPPSGDEVTSNIGSIVETSDPATCVPLNAQTYCAAPGKQLYLRNSSGNPPNSEPSAGFICINKRENAIPDYAINANSQAHSAISAYLKQQSIPSSPWLYYKLVNVQYFPYDKLLPKTPNPNGSLYNPKPPYSAMNPPASSFYQANIVVETNRSLQLFSGGLSPAIATDWNSDGTPHKNTYYNGTFHNMGGCMGCHGSQGQNPKGQAGDFSVILARGNVGYPEPPAIATSQGMTQVRRNRSLSR